MDRTACTEPQCLHNGALYLYLYLYSPYGPYGLYRASVPVQRCALPLPIPVLPLWTVRPVQSLSACTTVRFTFTYTCTPPMDRTACTEPQCLYKGALYLYLYLYSIYGPYGLYNASVPVQRCTLPFFTFYASFRSAVVPKKRQCYFQGQQTTDLNIKKKQVTIVGLVAVAVKIMTVWNVKSCNLLTAYQHFRGSGSLHFQRQGNLIPKFW